MSNANAKVQVNFKSGEGYDATLVNVYAESPQELAAILADVTRLAPDIAQARAAVALAHGIEVQKGSVQPAQAAPQPPAQQSYQQDPAPSPWSQPQQAPPQFAQQGQAPGPTCQHGAMVYKEKRNQDGSFAWRAHMCPAPKGPGQCEPKWLPKK